MPGMKSNLLWPLSFSAAGGTPSHHPISRILPFSTNFSVLTITLARAATLNISNCPRQALPLRRLSSERSSWQSAQSPSLLPQGPEWAGTLSWARGRPNQQLWRLPTAVQRGLRCCELAPCSLIASVASISSVQLITQYLRLKE